MDTKQDDGSLTFLNIAPDESNKHFARVIGNMRRAKKPISETDFLQRCASWWGWCKHSDSKYLIQKLNKTAPYEIKFKR